VLSASEIRDLLAALDAELAKSSIRAEVYLLGGAVMSLARSSTTRPTSDFFSAT
jgi:hypothetical protein